jgi:tetratricopeptide (TPR) repeat protein
MDSEGLVRLTVNNCPEAAQIEKAHSLIKEGGDCHRKRAYAEAEQKYLEALDILLKVHHPDHRDIADVRYALGTACSLFTLRHSIPCLHRSSPHSWTAHTPSLDIFSIASHSHPQGMLFENDGRYDEAEVAHAEALRIRRSMLPSGHVDVLKSISSLAFILTILNKYPAAETLYKDALQQRMAVVPAENLDVASLMCSLGNVLINQKKSVEAEGYYREALRIYKLLLPPDHSHLVSCAKCLKDVLRRNNKASEADSI